MFSWYEKLETENKFWFVCLVLLLGGIAAGLSRWWFLIIPAILGGAWLANHFLPLIIRLEKQVHQTLILSRVTQEKLDQQFALTAQQREQIESADREIAELLFELRKCQPELAKQESLQTMEPSSSSNLVRAETVRKEIEKAQKSQPPADFAFLSIPDPLEDDRKSLKAGDRCVLIIEDEMEFARMVMEMIKARSFGCLVVNDANSGIILAERFKPRAILMDMGLTASSSWEFMLGLRANPRTCQIPVHFLTCQNSRGQAVALGAVGILTKPITYEQIKETLASVEQVVARKIKKLLVVGKTPYERTAEFLEEKFIAVELAETGAEAICTLSKAQFDCVIADLELSDFSGFDLLEHVQAINETHHTPIILYSDRDFPATDLERIKQLAGRTPMKRTKNLELLAKEIMLFLLLLEDDLPLMRKKKFYIASN